MACPYLGLSIWYRFRADLIWPVGENILYGRNVIFGVRCQITWRPSLFPIGSLDKLLIPIGPLFLLQDDFLALVTESVGVRTLTQHYL